jgi:hypothetical protein
MGQEEKKPTFKIGDIVVVMSSRTVGTITDVEELDGEFLYKVNHSEKYYSETSLHSISTYETTFEGGVYEIEQLEIEYKFFFGDLVYVDGYGSDIFKVVGIHTEIWRYKEGAWEEKVYELSRILDGEWLEAGEEEMMLIADGNHAEAFLQKLALLVKKDQTSLELHDMMEMSRKSEKESLRLKKERQEIIDGLLDVYNDYKYLYQMFHDEKYEKVMNIALKNLERYTSEKKID